MMNILSARFKNEDFAYFYEMTMIRDNYIQPIEKLIINIENK